MRMAWSADADGASLSLVDTTHAGRNGKSAWTATVTRGERAVEAVLAWWRDEEPRALTRDLVDARDVLASAQRAGLRVESREVKAVRVAPSDGAPIVLDSPEVAGEIAFHAFALRSPDRPWEVALPPDTWTDESCRRVWSWARKLGSTAVCALGFDGFVRAVNELLYGRGVEVRVLDTEWSARTAYTCEEVPF